MTDTGFDNKAFDGNDEPGADLAPQAPSYEQSMTILVDEKRPGRRKVLLFSAIGLFIAAAVSLTVVLVINRVKPGTENVGSSGPRDVNIVVDYDIYDELTGQYKEVPDYVYDKCVEYLNEYKSERIKQAMAGEVPGNAKEVEKIQIEVFADSGYPVRGKYTGTVVDDKPEGWGYFITGSDYQADFVAEEDYLESYDGVIADGWIYIGQWHEGKMNGSGKTLWVMQYFEGEYENDNEVYGTIQIFGAPYHYTGEWKNGEPCGQGSVFYDNGEFFTGTFTDALNGNGVYTLPDGSTYKAYFQDGNLYYEK